MTITVVAEPRRLPDHPHAAVSTLPYIDVASETPAPRSVAPADAAQPMDVIFIEGYTGRR